jgi:uncharacterized protein (TIGR00290 family)
MRKKAVVAWSGGKDSALALHEILCSGSYEVIALLTTVAKDHDRVGIHDVRRVLLEHQAKALRIPLEELFIPKGATNAEYETVLVEAFRKHRGHGVSSVVFGDLFLEDIRKYRERLLAEAEVNGVFPLWKRDTAKLARTFIDLGFRAMVTSVDSRVLGKDSAGREYDEKFLLDLPAGVDPCGENGEFHTFVYDGPIFHERVVFKKGEIALKDNRFYTCDLLAVELRK